MRSSTQRNPMMALTLTLLTLGLGTGCQTIEPWERGILAETMMNPDRDALRDVFAEHMWFSREAASGGRGIGGGGCGCN